MVEWLAQEGLYSFILILQSMALLLMLLLVVISHAANYKDGQGTIGSLDMSGVLWQSKPIVTVMANEPEKDGYMETVNRMLQDEEQQRRQKANEEAFQSLRKGLENWQSKPQHLRKSSSHQAVQKLQIMNKANNKESVFQPKHYDPQEDLREAALIDLEEAPPTPPEIPPQRPKATFNLSHLFYIVAGVVLFLLALRWLQKCMRNAPRIQPHLQQAESLSTL